MQWNGIRSVVLKHLVVIVVRARIDLNVLLSLGRGSPPRGWITCCHCFTHTNLVVVIALHPFLGWRLLYWRGLAARWLACSRFLSSLGSRRFLAEKVCHRCLSSLLLLRGRTDVRFVVTIIIAGRSLAMSGMMIFPSVQTKDLRLSLRCFLLDFRLALALVWRGVSYLDVRVRIELECLCSLLRGRWVHFYVRV